MVLSCRDIFPSWKEDFREAVAAVVFISKETTMTFLTAFEEIVVMPLIVSLYLVVFSKIDELLEPAR